MSTLSLNQPFRAKRPTHIQPFRRILDLQQKQKYYNNSRLRRLHTQQAMVNPSMFSSTQNITIAQKKLIEYSTFLPAIKKKESPPQPMNLHMRRFSTNQQYDPNQSNTIDTEYEAMQHISECQTIIENLKKLTNYNKVRAEKIQMRYLSPKVETKMSHYNDVYRSSPSVERQPSFFQSSEDNFSHPYAVNKKNSKIVPLKKYQGLFEEGLSKIEPLPKTKPKSQYDDFGEFQSRVKQTSQFSDEENMQSEQSRFKSKNTIRDKKSGLSSARLPNSESSQAKGKQNYSLKEQLQEDEQSNENNRNSEEEAERQRRLQQQQEQLRKARQRQKYLLKYLMKAKMRGSELQKKIVEYKKTFGSSGSPSGKSRVHNPQESGSKKVDKERDRDSNQEMELERSSEEEQQEPQNEEQEEGSESNNNQDLIMKMVQQNADD